MNNKTSILVLVFLAIHLLAFSDLYAQWQVISNQGGPEVSFVDGNTGFGLEQKSIDGGVTWQSMANSGVAAVDFTNTLMGHIVFNTVTGPPTYWQSADGGNTWIDKSAVFPGTFGASLLDFVSVDTGFAAGNALFKTTDGGNTWSTLSFGSLFSPHSLRFVNGAIGFIGGNIPAVGPHLMKTTDGGNSWNSIPIPFTSTSNFLTIVYPSSASDIYAINAVDNTGEILYSGNGGNSWVSQYLDSNNIFYDIDFPTIDTGYVVGRNYDGDPGLIIRTTDGGNSWFVQTTNYQHALPRCDFINGQVGWVSGNNGDILHTSNGGVTSIAGGTIKDEFLLNVNHTIVINYLEITNKSKRPGTIILYDLTGKVLMRTNILPGNTRLDVKNISSGIYVVGLFAGKRQIIRKILISRE